MVLDDGGLRRALAAGSRSSSLILAAVIFGILLSSSPYSHLPYHALVETTISTVPLSVFIITWSARRYMDNNFLLVVGVGNLFVSMLNLVHMLAYRGMDIFPGGLLQDRQAGGAVGSR